MLSKYESKVGLPRYHVVPAFFLLCVIFLVPFLMMLALSMTNYNLIKESAGPTQWIGLSNYATAIWSDELLHQSLSRTLLFASLAVTCEMFLGLVIASILAQLDLVARRLLPLVVLPSLLSPVLIALMWLFMLHPQYGPVLWVGREIGISLRESPFARADLALITIIVMDIWQWLPFVSAVLMLGILNVPRSSVESARVDGATEIYILKTIIFPIIRPLLLAVTVLRFIDAFREFDRVFIVTGGGPGTTTETLGFYLWRIAFKYWDIGYGSAIGILFYLVVGALSYLLYRALTRSPIPL